MGWADTEPQAGQPAQPERNPAIQEPTAAKQPPVSPATASQPEKTATKPDSKRLKPARKPSNHPQIPEIQAIQTPPGNSRTAATTQEQPQSEPDASPQPQQGQGNPSEIRGNQSRNQDQSNRAAATTGNQRSRRTEAGRRRILWSSTPNATGHRSLPRKSPRRSSNASRTGNRCRVSATPLRECQLLAPVQNWQRRGDAFSAAYYARARGGISAWRLLGIKRGISCAFRRLPAQRDFLASCPQSLYLSGFPSCLRGSRHSDSNRGPTVYKTVALPLSYAG